MPEQSKYKLDQINLNDQAYIASNASGNSGNSGNIKLHVNQIINMKGNARIGTSSDIGQAGQIEITTNQIRLADNALVMSRSMEEGSDDTGSIRIKAKEITLSESAFLSTNTNGPGDAGLIEITADQINLADNAYIWSSSLQQATGNTGNIVIKVKNMTLSGTSTLNIGSSGLGIAGSIDITADQIHLAGDATIINYGDRAVGDTGNLWIKVKNITLSEDSAVVTAAFGSSKAGEIEIIAEQINLTENAFITSNSLAGSNNFGEIRLEASQSIKLSEGAAIGINKRPGVHGENGGNVYITTPYLSLIGQGDTDGDGDMVGDSALITVTALSGSLAPPGIITINSDQIYLANGATISANSHNASNAGNIVINGADSLSLQDAYISTNSATATGGQYPHRRLQTG
jgi:lipopolysaccharide export system protein LptA